MADSSRRSPRINWPQAAGEASLLFLGVVLALGAQAWWEARTDRGLQREHIGNLLEEAQENADGLERIVEYHETRRDLAASVLRSMQAGRSHPDSIRSQVLSLVAYDVFLPSRAAVDNLIGAGGLGLIEDPELRLQISKYAHAIETHSDVSADLQTFQTERFRTFLSQNVPLLGPSAAFPEPVPPTRFDFDTDALFRSLEFENLLLLRVRTEADAARFAQTLLDQVNELFALVG